MRGMCFNWKVIGGLAVVGLGIWFLVPSVASVALPLLLVAACPLSMLLMMRGMKGGQCDSHAPAATQEHPVARTRSKQLEELRVQLAQAQGQQQALSSRIAELEGEDSSVPAPSQAPRAEAAPESGARS